MAKWFSQSVTMFLSCDVACKFSIAIIPNRSNSLFFFLRRVTGSYQLCDTYVLYFHRYGWHSLFSSPSHCPPTRSRRSVSERALVFSRLEDCIQRRRHPSKNGTLSHWICVYLASFVMVDSIDTYLLPIRYCAFGMGWWYDDDIL